MIDSIKLLTDLSNANGISGFEDEVLEVIKGDTKDLFNVKEDSFRNMYLYPKDYSGKKPIVMLDGHSDEVGFMVKSIKRNGTVSFIPIGGWYSQNVSAHKVKIRNSEGKYISGIISSKPPHFMTSKERNSIIEIEDMVIDVGASSFDEIVNNYKIEPGAPIIPDVEFSYDKENDIMLGKAFDNRLGCGCAIETLINLKDDNLDVDIVGSISAQEEVGTRGAAISSRFIKPDVAIVFEGTPADDTFRDEYESQSRLKKGPQIRHRDSSMIANPRFVKFAREIAKKFNIPFQDAVRLSGGTDGGKISISNYGVPTIVIGVPVRYAHTHYGISSYNDYKLAIKWAAEIIRNLNNDIIYKL